MHTTHVAATAVSILPFFVARQRRILKKEASKEARVVPPQSAAHGVSGESISLMMVRGLEKEFECVRKVL